MKWSFATVGVIALGIIGVAIIMLFQQITTSNENDYYLLKEITEAAMIDAVDIPYYRETGDLKIVKEKFVENFTRRFAESTVFTGSGYTISFYDIMEVPPKVSIIIDTGIGEYTINGNTDDYNIKNKLDAILEYTGKYTNVTSSDGHYNNPYVTKTITKTYYAMPGKSVGSNSLSFGQSLEIPGELTAPNVKNIKLNKIENIKEVSGQAELNQALLKRELSFEVGSYSTNYGQYIDDFATDINVSEFFVHNCDSSEEDKNYYRCDEDNKYWVSFSLTTSDLDKNKAIFKYDLTWSYDEYEFSN